MGGRVQILSSRPSTNQGFLLVHPACPVVPSLPPYKKERALLVSPRGNAGTPSGVEIGGDVKMNSSSGVPPCCSSLAGHGSRGKKGDMQGLGFPVCVNHPCL